ncbi:phosphoribosyl-ATP diphosphatase [Companilactobacillus keshanensis]|uniref:Phosphoribosyl-ATP pyrophosphatase n=1 Tax=Companilactobacillus keshanensis TaxID=2486003 RepID=A0ABW4BVQ7_9LACO|nr:phosphoribosyl-ATP diphosphatase [Companilactobacillus keshanensis]
MQNLDELYAVIKKRQDNPQKGSYTDYLFGEGLDKILKKFGEESTEVIISAKNENKPRGDDELVYESADLLYHLCVLWVEKGVSFDQIKEELSKREGLMSEFKDRPEIKDL